LGGDDGGAGKVEPGLVVGGFHLPPAHEAPPQPSMSTSATWPFQLYPPGDSPIELENPEEVRGLTLSAYGLPTLVNDRTSFW